MALAGGAAAESAEFWDGVPFGDPTWYRGWRSPYFNDSHRAYREKVREFVENEVGCPGTPPPSSPTPEKLPGGAAGVGPALRRARD